MASLVGFDGEYDGNDQLTQIVRMRPPELPESDNGWELRVEIQLVLHSREPIEVELLAYADDGSLVCSEDVGTQFVQSVERDSQIRIHRTADYRDRGDESISLRRRRRRAPLLDRRSQYRRKDPGQLARGR